MKPKLLFINQYYYPDLASTGQLMTQLCESLSSDFNVTVLTGFPSYSVKSKSFPGLFKRERINGVTIIRVFSTTFSRVILPLRMVNYLTYFFGAFLTAFFIKRPDIVVTQTDPPVIGLVGVALRFIKRSQHCVVFQDVFPEVAVAIGRLKGPPIHLLRWVRTLLLKRCTMAVAISSGMAQQLINRGLDGERVRVISNWIDTQLVKPHSIDHPFRQARGWGDQFVVMHSGNMGLSQDFEVILNAAQRLLSEKEIHFAIIGDGARRRWVEAEIHARKLTNVSWGPYQPLERLQYSLGAANVHLVTLKKGLENFIVPSKIYGIMGASRPVIALVPPQSEVYDIVKRNNIGEVMEPGDVSGLVAVILKFCRDRAHGEQMGHSGRLIVEQKFSRQVCSKAYSELFLDMLKISSKKRGS